MLELNKIYHGDCLDVMKSIPDKSIDLVLCDLPYGETSSEDDIVIPFEPLWEQYNRICKDNCAIILFGQGLFYVDLVNSNRKDFRYDLVWDKILTSGFLSANQKPLRVHEQIAIFYKSMPVYNPQMRLGQPSHSKGRAYLSKEMKNSNYGKYHVVEDKDFSNEKYPTTIVTCQKPHPSKAIHRTEKPVELLEWLIKTYSNEGNLVLDNCCGSASTCVAAYHTKRNFIGIEKDEEIFKTGRERVYREMMKRSLV